MYSSFQRVIAVCLAAAIAAPLSFAGESRRQSRTDLLEMAAELERRLGKGSVAIERGGTAHERTSTVSRADTRPPSPAVADQEALVREMNRERRSRGLTPLRLDPALSEAARDRVADMFRQRYFDHVAPDGTQPFVWIGRRGYRYSSVAENLATGYGSPAAVVSGWMGSPGHRANLLGRSFQDVGIAVADGSPTRRYAGPLVVAIYAAR